MARPLRKTTLDGTLYHRREAVEAEIDELTALGTTELEHRSALWPSTVPGFVSTEALVYFVRNLSDHVIRNKLTERLLARIVRRGVPSARHADGNSESLTQMNIQEDVVHRFIELLLRDWEKYDERLDYYEIQFNSAIAKDRLDASRRHWSHENRMCELGSEEAEISDQVETAMGSYDPFEAEESDKKRYRLLLEDAINTLPDFQRRIIEMLRQEIPIESKDPSIISISKVLGKTEKTIRTHRDKAFASLRLRLERNRSL